MTTDKTMTDGMIERYAIEAAEHGDHVASAIARKAIRHCYAAHDLTPAERARVDAMTAQRCRQLVAEWAADAAAQIDD